MSRSIHTTWADVQKARKKLFRDKKSDKYTVKALLSNLAKKRGAKRIHAHRIDSSAPDHLVFAPASIPISRKESAYLHFPATDEDIRELMNRLPAGTCAGMKAIRLSLGSRRQEQSDSSGDQTYDPYRGIYSSEYLPGMFRGHVLGTYTPSNTTINIFGFLYDRIHSDSAMWEVFLKSHMLTTLLHEIGHHQDFMTRWRHGRWLGSSRKRKEIYAEEREHFWAQQYLVPYLRQTYGREIDQLEGWIESHGGTRVPFEQMIGDPRSTVMGDQVLIRTVFGDIPDHVAKLARDVYRGHDDISMKLNFARNLYYSEAFDAALAIIAMVILADARCVDAHILKARIFLWQREFAPAEQAVGVALTLDDRDPEALSILIDICSLQEQWDRVITLTDRVLSFLRPSEYDWVYIMEERIVSLVKTGMREAALTALSDLEKHGGRRGKHAAAKIQTKYFA